ncbi:hypothetical protein DNF23_55205, partial [Pseudomonas syringae pv. pisi]
KCSEKELSYLEPPQGKSCGEYMASFIENAGGYLQDPNSTERCGYCRYTDADQYLLTVYTKYSYIWRNVGFFCVYIIFNIIMCLVLYKIFRLTTWRMPKIFKRKS